jgi:hypothetical protein
MSSISLVHVGPWSDRVSRDCCQLSPANVSTDALAELAGGALTGEGTGAWAV